eukprot:5914249-Prymnesium_polylepis.2
MAAEAAGPVTEEQLRQEAAQDASKWGGVQSAVEGESDLVSYTEDVDININTTTGRYERGEFDV